MQTEPASSDARPEPARARAPRGVAETGLPFLFLAELLAKTLSLRGQTRLPELAAHMKLGAGVLEALTAFLRAEKLCELSRRGDSGTDADLLLQLSDAGRLWAAECRRRSAYCGPAPVTLDDYRAQVETSSVARLRVTRADVARQFRDVVADPGLLDQLGTAMNSGRAIFIHGQAGSGKTYLAESLHGLLRGDIAVPHAIMIDGEVLPFYDAALHRPAPDAPQAVAAAPLDPRWVRGLRRPAVLSGGELTLDMLDLGFDPVSRLYQAPPHLKANNGIFIIDDLGRQRCAPAELMNRWIVPMDRRVDYLSLHTGHKFLVPFDVVVVFSSNFLPERLSDAAFLRRLGYKIHVPPQSAADYERTFRQVCAQYQLPFCADALAYLLRELHGKKNVPLLACYPRDLLGQLRDLARYENRPPSLDRRQLDWAWNNHFSAAVQSRPRATTIQRRPSPARHQSEENT